MKQPFKILLFKEWKESPNYKIDKWFIDRKIQIEKWFVNDLPDFEIDYFEWSDPNQISDIYTASLYFNEPNIQYRLDIILDADKVKESNIDEFNIELTGYSQQNGDILGSLNKTATLDQLIPNLIIQLVSEFKTENLDDDGNRKINNKLSGPETNNDTEENEISGEVQEEQPEPEQPEQSDNQKDNSAK